MRHDGLRRDVIVEAARQLSTPASEFRERLCNVVSYSSSTFKAVVTIAGDTVEVTDVPVLSSYTPVAGDAAIALQNGADLILIGKVRTSADGASHTHTDSGWIAPTLQNAWVNFGSPHENAAYRKIGNIVYLRGTVKDGGSASPIFNLPVGYRPTVGRKTFACESPTHARIWIYHADSGFVVAGDVYFAQGDDSHVGLSGISFHL